MVRRIGKVLQAVLFVAVVTFFATSSGRVKAQTAFLFASMSDSHIETTNFTNTVNQIKSLNPKFALFNGDLENDGVVSSQMDPMINVLKNAGIFNNTFLVRGNHDDHLSGSAALWQSYFTTANRPLPAGVTNYVGIDSSSTYLTYSFDYDNSRFIGLDSNQYGDPPTSAQYTFLDQRLTDAENTGLTHAFIFVHPPEYCVESTHCGCQTATGCGPSTQFISLINKHPIVSATFHGHEHILAWVHMSSARVPGLTHEYEEFITSSSGNPYSFTPYPARMDYYNYSSSLTAFGTVTVNGPNFTVNFYHTGTTTPIWSNTFTKSGSATTVPTATPSVTSTPIKTPTPTPIKTPTPVPTPTKTVTPVPAPTQTPTGGLTRTMKYYGVDRGSPFSDANYANLASHSVKTIIVDTYINDASNSTSSKWSNVKALADKYNFNYVIWPNQGGDVSGCRWEYPFNAPVNGYYIGRVTTMLDFFASDPHFIGMVSSHEPSSAVSTGCNSTIADMTAIKSQLKTYMQSKGRADFKVWNYIDNITNLMSMSGYTPADIERVMDVAVTWQHCFGTAEGTCPAAKNKIIADRNYINQAGLDGKVDLVYLFQTFGYTNYGYTMPTLADMQAWDCQFVATNALDGFMYYTWGAWYDTDLANHPELWPEMDRVYNSCVNTISVAPTPSSSPVVVPAVKPGDANGDNKVDEADYAVWFSHFGMTSSGVSNGDFSGDGVVDGIDYAIWISNYNSN